jgi:hypothetical protein
MWRPSSGGQLGRGWGQGRVGAACLPARAGCAMPGAALRSRCWAQQAPAAASPPASSPPLPTPRAAALQAHWRGRTGGRAAAAGARGRRRQLAAAPEGVQVPRAARRRDGRDAELPGHHRGAGGAGGAGCAGRGGGGRGAATPGPGARAAARAAGGGGAPAGAGGHHGEDRSGWRGLLCHTPTRRPACRCACRSLPTA